jgi:hypothetical protein
VLATAAKIALAAGHGKDAGWNASTCSMRGLARSRPRPGLRAGEGGLDVAGMLAAAGKGQLDVLYLLGADEIDMSALGKAFVVYQGSHGDTGAQRADVILPGSAYTEKSATYVNVEGRAQMTSRAAFPPGDAKEDWAIVRALSAHVGHKLPYDSLPALRAAMYKEAPALARLDAVEPAGWPAWRRWRRAAALWAPSRSGRGCATSISPTRSRGPPPSWPSSARWPRACSRGRPERMASSWSWPEIWQAYLWPLLVMVFQSVVLLVALLVSVAFLLLMDRKVWAACSCAAAPTWWALRPAAVVRRSSEVRAQGAADPGRRRQGRVPAGAAGRLGPGAGRLGRDPPQRERLGPLGHLRPQRRHPLSLRHLLARRLRRHHGRLGLELEISLPRLAALGGADGVLRGLDRLRHHHRAAVRRLAQHDRHRQRPAVGPGTAAGLPNSLVDWHWLKLLADVPRVLHLGAGRDQPSPFDLPEAESELVAGFAVEYSSTPYLLFMLGEYVAITTMCALTTIMFLGGWLPPLDVWPLNLVPGIFWFLSSSCSSSSCSPW